MDIVYLKPNPQEQQELMVKIIRAARKVYACPVGELKGNNPFARDAFDTVAFDDGDERVTIKLDEMPKVLVTGIASYLCIPKTIIIDCSALNSGDTGIQCLQNYDRFIKKYGQFLKVANSSETPIRRMCIAHANILRLVTEDSIMPVSYIL